MNRSGDTIVTEVNRLDKNNMTSVFIKVDKILDPYGDGSPNEAIIIAGAHSSYKK